MLTVLALIAAAYLVWRLWPAIVASGSGPSAAPVDSTATINDRLAQARPGSTVEIEPGYYTETIRLRNDVTLKSTMPGGTYLAPSPGDSVAVIAENITGAALIGFHIGPDTTQHQNLYAGIRIHQAEVLIQHNQVDGDAGVGMLVQSAQVQLLNNTIQTSDGTGILLLPGSTALVQNNTLAGTGIGIEWHLDPGAYQAALRQENTFELSTPADSHAVVRVLPDTNSSSQ